MTPLVSQTTHLLSFLVVFGYGVILLILLSLIARRSIIGKSVLNFFGSRAILFSFLVAVVATGTSLFYSNVAGFAPCLLCWWQRIFMYSQVIVLGMALLVKDKKATIYALALSLCGAVIALYHTYIQFGGSPLVPCSADSVSCGKVYFLQYGFVTIPSMALAGFLLIISFMLASKFRSH